jgi:hypothetical protein
MENILDNLPKLNQILNKGLETIWEDEKHRSGFTKGIESLYFFWCRVLFATLLRLSVYEIN